MVTAAIRYATMAKRQPRVLPIAAGEQDRVITMAPAMVQKLKHRALLIVRAAFVGMDIVRHQKLKHHVPAIVVAVETVARSLTGLTVKHSHVITARGHVHK